MNKTLNDRNIIGRFVRSVDFIEFHWTMRLVLKSN